MHCADICLSATHNESARKLVMTQFEPCQYRHKSRYASVLQNRCFYTYIWLAYLVRFFERLLRQTTPKLLPLFECLPLLFLLMSLRYSVRPNITGRLSYMASDDPSGEGYEGGALYYAFPHQEVKTLTEYKTENQIPADPAIDLSRSNSLYQDGLNEVRVNALYGLNLIRAF